MLELAAQLKTGQARFFLSHSPMAPEWEKEITIQYGMAKGIDKLFAMVETLTKESREPEEEGQDD